MLNNLRRIHKYLISGEIFKSSRLIEFSPQHALGNNNKDSFYQIQKAFLYVKISSNMEGNKNEREELKKTESPSESLKIWIFQIFEDQVRMIKYHIQNF